MKIPLPNDTELELYESSYTPEQIEASIGKGMIIQNGTFWTWDVATSQYVDTGVHAGEPDDGSITTPKLADSAVTWPKLAPEARKSNDNLLDNAYFIGGGSQQGGGQFPINQKGQTEYTGIGYTIDRWYLNPYNGSMSMTLEQDCIVLTRSGNSTYPHIKQTIENPQIFAGKEITLSFLVKFSESNPQFMLVAKNTSGGGPGFLNINQITSIDADGLALLTGTAICPDDMPLFNVFFYSAPNSDSSLVTRIKAAKLELGGQQTLARESAGGWQLNNLPNFTDELMRCLRYQFIVKTSSTFSIIPLNGFSGAGLDTARASFTPPVPLRAAPAITLSGPWYIGSTTNFAKVEKLNFTVMDGPYVICAFTLETALNNVPITIATNHINVPAEIVFDANL